MVDPEKSEIFGVCESICWNRNFIDNLEYQPDNTDTQNIEQIHAMTQSSDASIREAQEQTHELGKLADDLQTSMNRFRV